MKKGKPELLDLHVLIENDKKNAQNFPPPCTSWHSMSP